MLRLLVLLMTLILPVAVQAQSAASPWVETESGRVRLVAAALAVGDRAQQTLGLDFDLSPGWKIYWRTPGDAGYPPKLDWTRSDNLADVQISWPGPKRFVLAGLQNYGYGGHVILPLTVQLTQAGRALAARLDVEFLACAQICVPMQARLDLTLPAGPALPSDQAHDISRFLALIPGDGSGHGLRVQDFVVGGQGDASRLRLTLQSDFPLDHPDVFIEPADLGSFDPPLVTLSTDRRQAVLTVAPAPGTVQVPLDTAVIRLTVVDGERSMDTTLTPRAVAALPQSGDPSLIWMLGLALLGGMILNVMPCVLPVLSIKLLGTLEHGGGDPRHIRLSFLASAAGVVTSFLGLGAVAVGLKLGGAAVGWGIQFQQPIFLAVMMAVVLVFAANLAGLFEIRLPSALLSVGADRAAAPTLLGNFLAGALATLLATPCSAPFLGTAVGFALARGPLEILLIFAVLGIGMAAPYLLVAAWPQAARRLPRPGRWMLWVKRIMALTLVGTALWLGAILFSLGGQSTTPTTGKSISWVPFDQAAINRAVAEGKLVFVDVTADWCITCKVNKAATIDRDPVASRLTEPDVIAMKADWTRPDPLIAAYLASFGRYGIPFNAVYGPKSPQGTALPEIPSQGDIMAALQEAR